MKIDAERLRVIAGKVGAAAKTATLAYTARSSALAPAEGTGTGWSTATAARSASVAWGTFVSRLSASVAGLGAEFTAAADDYVAADQRSAGRLGGTRWRGE